MMSVFFITFRSVTLAQRGEGLLKKNGIHCQLQRTPRWMEEQGCGYCLRLRPDAADTAIDLLRKNRIQFRKVYVQGEDGRVEEAAV